MPYVLRLNAGWSQKRLFLGMFLLGGFVCIASIMRLVSVSKESTDLDFSWNWVNQGIWAVVESNFAIVSACLPTLRVVWVCISKRKKNERSPRSPGTPALWTIGSAPSKQNRKRKAQWTFGESISTDSTHPFTALHDPEEEDITNKARVQPETSNTSSNYPESFNMAPLQS